MRFALVVGLAGYAAFAATAYAANTAIVDGVTIEGTESLYKSGVDEFFGIPYAQAKRWAPPTAAAALKNPFSATLFSRAPICPQADNATVEIGGTVMTQAEDCLVLNIYVPAAATAASKLPVYFFIHGGALTSGAGVEYNGSYLVAANNIVVVTINYRLGALGWLAQSTVQATAANTYQNVGDAGNYGLMDQQFALRWVKKNIAAFGGNPAKITIGGQSAGGLSVVLNLASTTTGAGLFRAAAIESGFYPLHRMPSLATYETNFGNGFVDAVLVGGSAACQKLTAASKAASVKACLNAAPFTTIVDDQGPVYGSDGIQPAYGTKVVPNNLLDALANGLFIKVPVMMGSNFNEGRYFEPGTIPFTSLSTVIAAGGPANYDLTNANGFCGGRACTYKQEINLVLTAYHLPGSENTAAFDATVAKDYPLSKYPDPYIGNADSADMGLAQVLTDVVFTCNALDAATDLAKYVSVYAYEFNDPNAPPIVHSPPIDQSPNNQYGYPTAAEHGAELQFLWPFPYTSDLSAAEQALQATMWSYWGDFVNNKNPNTGKTVPKWPAFTAATTKLQRLAPSPSTVAAFGNFATEHFCGVWEPILEAETPL